MGAATKASGADKDAARISVFALVPHARPKVTWSVGRDNETSGQVLV